MNSNVCIHNKPMIFQVFAVAVAGYAFWANYQSKTTTERVANFKNPYYPQEADISDHITRNTPFGFMPGHHPGKLDYRNPQPLIVLNEFNDKLIETQYGYAAEIGSPAINVVGYQALINDQFNIQEHPRLDPTRLDFAKGRHRRSEYAFIDRTP